MAENKKFTRKEIESRNTQQDAVFIIDNVVYNVTEFLEDHPGGVEVLMDNVGRDASQCFHDIGHSQDAKELRKKFVIGVVVDEDIRKVIKTDYSWHGSQEGDTLQGLLNAWMPPIAMAAVSILVYMYLFG